MEWWMWFGGWVDICNAQRRPLGLPNGLMVLWLFVGIRG